jgi:hypothetical protein
MILEFKNRERSILKRSQTMKLLAVHCRGLMALVNSRRKVSATAPERVLEEGWYWHYLPKSAWSGIAYCSKALHLNVTTENLADTNDNIYICSWAWTRRTVLECCNFYSQLHGSSMHRYGCWRMSSTILWHSTYRFYVRESLFII